MTKSKKRRWLCARDSPPPESLHLLDPILKLNWRGVNPELKTPVGLGFGELGVGGGRQLINGWERTAVVLYVYSENICCCSLLFIELCGIWPEYTLEKNKNLHMCVCVFVVGGCGCGWF